MEEFRKFSAQELTYLAIFDRSALDRLLFRCEKCKESINKIANAVDYAQKSFERYKITVKKAKRREMYKRHFNKKNFNKKRA